MVNNLRVSKFRIQAIVWDRSLFGPFRLITKLASLEERNVVFTQFLNGLPLPDMHGVRHIIFICRPHLPVMDAVASVIKDEEHKHIRPGQNATKTQFHLICVPRVTQMCIDQLSRKGVLGSLTTTGLPCYMFPVDSDLMSMELPQMLREVYVESDMTALHACAVALQTFQRTYGRIGRVFGKGQCAQTVWQLCRAMGSDYAATGESSLPIGGERNGTIDQLIIIDRSIDLMSVLATQLTYEGLIDEHVGIHQCLAKFPADTSVGQSVPADGLAAVNAGELLTRGRDTKDIILNSADDIFAELRDKHVHAVGASLSKHAISVAALLNVKDMAVQEIRQMMNIMPRLLHKREMVARHTTIAHQLKQHTESADFLDELACEQDFLMCENCDKPNPFIEDLMARGAPLRAVLRLMCMQCQASTGLKPKVLEHYKRELVQVYGVQVLLTLRNLERAGLLRLQSGARTYAVLRKSLDLTVDKVNELQPCDISYVHTWYAPLSTRIVERCMKNTLQDVLSCLHGPQFLDMQASTDAVGREDYGSGDVSAGSHRRSSLISEISLSQQPRVIMVFFVGGCTFAEVSALRFLAQEDSNVEFVIGTTKILNKHTFLDEFIEGMEKGQNAHKNEI